MMMVSPIMSKQTAMIPSMLFAILLVTVLPSFLLAQDFSVRSSKEVYEFEEPVDIDFVNSDPSTGDWVGIYDSSVDAGETEENGVLWKFTCGDQHENSCDRQDGRIRFSNNDGAEERWALDWPLPPGRYKAYLLRRRRAIARPFRVKAEGNVFEIVGREQSLEEFVSESLDRARSMIIDIIDDDVKMGPKFLRLAFHDCVGGCDGCVEVRLEENFGLEAPIDALAPVVERFAGDDSPVSRADIWALAAMTAAQKLQPNDSDAIRFPMIHFGREDCPNAKDGPSRHIPDLNTGTHELFTFFEDEFGFDIEMTVAIMGAHTVGRLATENSGVDGPSGWLLNPDDLDNEYYAELIGGDDPDDDMEDVLVNEAPGWSRAEERNSNNRFPRRHIWVGFPTGVKIVMLNVDIALVRFLGESADNLDPSTGEVNCRFVGRESQRCPHNRRAIGFAAEYKHDNRKWLRDFRDVMDIMITNGYDEDGCTAGVCGLRSREEDV